MHLPPLIQWLRFLMARVKRNTCGTKMSRMDLKTQKIFWRVPRACLVSTTWAYLLPDLQRICIRRYKDTFLSSLIRWNTVANSRTRWGRDDRSRAL